jgi:hypothetical protein
MNWDLTVVRNGVLHERIGIFLDDVCLIKKQ